MKTNNDGLLLIEMFKSEYELCESRTMAERFLNCSIKRRITRNQFSALVCLTVALGIDTIKDSGIIRLINAGNLKAADIFDQFIHQDDEQGRRVLDPFLIKQRELEKALFLMPEIVPKRKRNGQT